MPYQYMPGYQPMYYQPPMPDQLAQLRGVSVSAHAAADAAGTAPAGGKSYAFFGG